MKSKKLISTILALLLALQCIAPAFASEADVPPETGETSEEVLPETPPEDPIPQEPEETQPPEDAQEPGEVQEPEDTQPPDAVQDQPEGEPGSEDVPDAAEEPTEPDTVPLEDLIDVLVPSTGQMILNPYRLPVDLEGGEISDQIIHSCQTLINQSDFPVIVNVSVTGTIPAESEAAFVSAPPSPDAPDKDVFLYTEFQPYSDWWEGGFYDLPNQVLVSERGDAKENVLTLDAQGEGYFRLFGEMSEAPEEPWSKTDTFGAVLTFTFTPVYMEPEPTEETEDPEDTKTPDTPPEEPSTDPGMSDMPEEDPSEDPGAPEETEPPADQEPAPPEETEPPAEEPEPSEPPVEDPDPVPADPPEQDAPEPPETPGEPDPPAEPEAAGAQEGGAL